MASSPAMLSARSSRRWVSELLIAGTGDFANGGEDIIIGEADLADIGQTNPYKDLHGNADATKILVQDPVTFADQGDARAQVLLALEAKVAQSITLDVDEFDVDGDFQNGDTVLVYDPPDVIGTTPYNYGGTYVFPKEMRIFSVSFPSRLGMGFFYRDLDGNYTDLSPYIEHESGTTRIVVGERHRSPFDDVSVQAGSAVGAINLPPNAPTTPALVTMTTPFGTSSYVSATGDTVAKIQVRWAEPLNTDGSPITDGSHYLVRYKRSDQ